MDITASSAFFRTISCVLRRAKISAELYEAKKAAISHPSGHHETFSDIGTSEES